MNPGFLLKSGETEAAVSDWRLWQQIHASNSLTNEADRSSALNLVLAGAGSWFIGSSSAVLECAVKIQAATLLLHHVCTRAHLQQDALCLFLFQDAHGHSLVAFLRKGIDSHVSWAYLLDRSLECSSSAKSCAA